MTLQEACKFLENIELVPINLLDNESEIKDFCNKYRIHGIQPLSHINKVNKLISELNNKELFLCTDPFKIRFVFAKCNGHIIAYGPYCTELLSIDEVNLLIKHLNIRDLDATTLSKIRGSYYVKRQQNIQYYLNTLLAEINQDNNIRPCREYSFLENIVEEDINIKDSDYSIKLVREHYANEQILIDAISEGNFPKALNAWRVLHQAVSYKNIGHTLEISRISAGITRTLLRIGAIRAGLPAEINDQISGHSTMIISRARNIDTINIEHERLIKEYCDVINEYKSKSYSTTVQSLKYLIDNNYAESLNLEDMAKELSISASQLIRQFKEETTTTPIAYLNKVRMQHAANSLRQTNLSIQEIAAMVGIYDPNYFVKVFKKEFSLTPSSYRKQFREILD